MDESYLSVSELSGSWFDVSQDPATYPFSDEAITGSLLRRREELGGSLFFHDLLSLAGVDTQLFPPSTPKELTDLLEDIENSEWEEIKRQCLNYYILKYWKDGRELKYAAANLMSPTFTTLSDAYFYLDDNDMPEAVRCLCDPRVKPDLVPKIMRALSLASPELVVKFVRFAKPILPEEESLDIYLRALCTQSIIAAWNYTRSFPEVASEDAQRCRLVWTVLEYCLIPKPKPTELMTLLTFPLTVFEQTVINTYALRPPPALSEPSLAILQDLITVRLIHQGKYSDAITLDRLFLSEAAAAGRMGGAITKAAEARRETFKEIISVLPDIQRQLLELKLDDYSSAALPGAQNPVTDLSSSWDDVAEAVPGHNAPPATPMSASAAFRKANPKVAVLRAFAQSNGPSSKLEGTPAAGTPGPSRARTPGSVRHPMQSSQFGQAPGTPINPFLSRSKLASTPFDPRNRQFVSGSISGFPFSTPDLRVRQAPSYPFLPNPSAPSPLPRPPPAQAPVGGSFAPTAAASHLISSPQTFDPFRPSKALSHTPWLPRSADPTPGHGTVTPTKRNRASVEPLWQEPEVHMRSPVDDRDAEEDEEEARLNRLAAPFSNPPPRRSLSAMQEDIEEAEEAEVLTRDEGIDKDFPGAFPHHEEQRTDISEGQDRLALPTFLSSAPTPHHTRTTRNKSSQNNTRAKSTDPDDAALPPRITSRSSHRASSVISDATDEGASRQLRRSSRLSAAPSSPEPKSKKTRSSSSPPPAGTKSGATKAKRKSTKTSAQPVSKRSTRRTVSVLKNVEE